MEKKALSTNQLKAISAFLEGDSIEKVASKVKVSRITIYNWLKLDIFKTKLENERQELFEAGLNTLKCATSKAAKKLIELLDSKDESVRRLAAGAVINMALKVVEQRELVERVKKLEELVEKVITNHNQKPSGWNRS